MAPLHSNIPGALMDFRDGKFDLQVTVEGCGNSQSAHIVEVSVG